MLSSTTKMRKGNIPAIKELAAMAGVAAAEGGAETAGDVNVLPDGMGEVTLP